MKCKIIHQNAEGTSVELRAETREPSTGALIDPAGIIVRVKSPAGVEAAYVPVRESLGVYRATVLLDAPGQWFFRLETTAPGSARESSVVVRTSNFA